MAGPQEGATDSTAGTSTTVVEQTTDAPAATETGQPGSQSDAGGNGDAPVNLFEGLDLTNPAVETISSARVAQLEKTIEAQNRELGQLRKVAPTVEKLAKQFESVDLLIQRQDALERGLSEAITPGELARINELRTQGKVALEVAKATTVAEPPADDQTAGDVQTQQLHALRQALVNAEGAVVTYAQGRGLTDQELMQAIPDAQWGQVRRAVGNDPVAFEASMKTAIDKLIEHRSKRQDVQQAGEGQKQPARSGTEITPEQFGKMSRADMLKLNPEERKAAFERYAAS